MSLSLSFPDSTYTSSNKPSVVTLKADLQDIETDHNTHLADTAAHGATGALVGLTTLQQYVPPGIFFPYAGSSAPTGYLLCDGSAVSRTTYSDLFTAISTNYGVGNGSTPFNVPNMQGKFPIGKSSSDADFDTLNETGGDKTSSSLIAHTHSVDPPSTTSGYISADHSHAISVSNGGVDHNHTYSGTVDGESGHTHGTQSGGQYMWYGATSDQEKAGLGAGSTISLTTGSGSSTGHQHNYSGTVNGASAYSHSHSASSGGVSSNHTHTVDIGSFTSGSGGSGSSFSIMNPYIVVNYIIKT
jgi:microcystin-dependent protein